MHSNLLKVDEVTAVRQQRWLFEPISFELSSGEWGQVQGANGVGKSTFLRILAGLYPLRKGQVLLNGSPKDKVAQYGHYFFYLGHKNFLNPDLSVSENLHFFIRLHQIKKPASITEVLKTLNIDGLSAQSFKYLSFGQQQRVALTCAILHPAKFWLLDEPLVGLDQYSVQCFTNALKHHLSQGGAALIATHQTLPDIVPNHRLSFHRFIGEEAW